MVKVLPKQINATYNIWIGWWDKLHEAPGLNGQVKTMMFCIVSLNLANPLCVPIQSYPLVISTRQTKLTTNGHVQFYFGLPEGKWPHFSDNYCTSQNDMSRLQQDLFFCHGGKINCNMTSLAAHLQHGQQLLHALPKVAKHSDTVTNVLGMNPAAYSLLGEWWVVYPLVNKHSYRKPPAGTGKSTINGPFSISMLNCQGVHLVLTCSDGWWGGVD